MTGNNQKTRRRSFVNRKEMSEINYWDKLSDDEKQYLDQFLLEYYQADFNFDKPIHPDSLRKDCYKRNNDSKNRIEHAHIKNNQVSKPKVTNTKSRVTNRKVKEVPYSPDDYIHIMDKESDDE